MSSIDPGESLRRSPQELAEEFDSLWAQSMQRAAFRPRLSLEEFKRYSSRIRRMAKLTVVPEHDSGIRRTEQSSWPGSSRKAG